MEVKAKSGTDLSIVAALFALALVVRLAYLFEIESNPLFYDPAGDGRVYNEWAARIASGDILGDGVFYQAPLYPYFLGLLQFLMGRDLWSVRLVQVILGAASCSLIFLAGKAFMGRAAGAAAGVILSLYAPAIFYDGLIQKAVLDLFLISVLLVLLAMCQGKPKPQGWLGLGVVLALLALSRENVIVWTVVVPVWIWLYFSLHSRRRRALWVVYFFLGCALVLFPVGLRNLMVGGEFTLTTSQLGPNLYIGNHPKASGTYTPLRGGHGDAQFERHDATELAEQALGRSLSPAEVSRFWLDRTLDYVVSQPLDWLQLMGRKWLLVWNVAEVEDADDFYLHREWSTVLGILGRVMTFGLLAPLGAIGCVLTWEHRRRLWILYALLGTYALSVAVIYVLGRYRFSLVPMLVIFAGAAAVEGVAFYRAPRLRRGLVCAAVGLAALVIVNWPVMGTPGPSAAGYNNLGNALVRQGREDEAIRSYERALVLDPRYAAIHFNLGNLLVARGDLDSAARHYKEAAEASPDFHEAYWALGNVAAMRNDLDSAVELFRRSLAISPLEANALFSLGTVLGKRGQLDDAVGYLKKAIEIRPDHAETHHNLGRVLATLGRLADAMAAFQAALVLWPEYADAHEGLALAYRQIGERKNSIRHYEEALRIMKLGQEGGQ